MRTLRGSVAITLLSAQLTTLGFSTDARADEGPTTREAQTEEARGLFAQGKAELAGGHPDRALTSLTQSHALVASPNTELLIGRALAALGRRVEATQAFERADQEASRRVALGESKYAPTVTAARDEGAALRARLGTVLVHVTEPAGVTVVVDGHDVPIGGGGDAMLLHEPGPVEIVVRRGDIEQRQVATAFAGSTLRIDFAGSRATVSEERSSPAPTTAAAPPEPGRPWAWPLALASGGAALAGAGVFTVFGLKSGATYDDLAARCGPTNCGPADRADADRGAREQTIANVGLAVAGVAAVSFVTFLLLTPKAPSRSARVVDGVSGGTL